MKFSVFFHKLGKELLFVLFSVSTLVIPFAAFHLSRALGFNLLIQAVVVCCACFSVIICHDFYERFILKNLTSLTQVQKEEISQARVSSSIGGIMVLVMFGCLIFSVYLLKPAAEPNFSKDQLLLMVGFCSLFLLRIPIIRLFAKRRSSSQGDVSCN